MAFAEDLDGDLSVSLARARRLAQLKEKAKARKAKDVGEVSRDGESAAKRDQGHGTWIAPHRNRRGSWGYERDALTSPHLLTGWGRLIGLSRGSEPSQARSPRISSFCEAMRARKADWIEPSLGSARGAQRRLVTPLHFQGVHSVCSYKNSKVRPNSH